MTVFQPDSAKLTADSSAWKDYLAALYTYLTNTSTRFQVEHETNDGGAAGNVSMLIEPSDANESWQLNLRYDSNSGELKSLIDPGGGITDSSTPTGSATNKASPEQRAGQSGPSYHVDFLVAEHADMLQLMFKDGGNSYTPWVLQLGRVYLPPFASDPGEGLDGLGMLLGEPSYTGSNSWGDSAYSRIRVGDTTWDSFISFAGTTLGAINYGNKEPDRPFPMPIASGDQSAMVGITKYAFFYYIDETAITRIEDGSGKGALYIKEGTGTSYHVVGWDPTVTP